MLLIIHMKKFMCLTEQQNFIAIETFANYDMSND